MLRIKGILAGAAIAAAWSGAFVFGHGVPAGSSAPHVFEIDPAMPGANATVASRRIASGRNGLSAEVERYANRERVTPALDEFRGGDTITLGTSSVAVIMAVVLVLVLL